MSAELLRKAAQLMRDRADDATEGPWVSRRGPGEHVYGETGSTRVADVATRDDRRHIASWHPSVALAVANLLEATAWDWPEASLPLAQRVAALDVARTYLGESA